MPERYSALEVAKKIQLPIKSNIREEVDLDLTPYLIAPISLIGNPEVEWIFLIAPTQSGKTLFLQVVVADSIDQDPGTMIYALADEKSGKDALYDKVISMIKASPFLNKHVENDKDLALNHIRLDNMTIYPAWSNSPATVSSKPTKKVIGDEIRLWSLEIKGEANALKQLNDRMTTYKSLGTAQGYGVSSCSIKGDLLYEQMKVPGTIVLYYHVQCKGCLKYILPDFYRDILPYSNEKNIFGRRKSLFVCPFCKHKHDDKDFKKEYNRNAAYEEKGFEGKLTPRPLKELIKYRVVFRYCSCSSPFRKFKEITREFLATKDKLHDFKNFIMCWLAKFWVDDESKTTVRALEERKGSYVRGFVPEGTMFLTAGVDSQDDGFFVTVRAFGFNCETWLVDHFHIHCPVHTSNVDIVRESFTNRIEERKYGKWRIALWAIDTGGNRTREVYDATDGLANCIRVKGATAQMRTEHSYNAKLDLHHVRTPVYLDETEERCQKDGWHLPQNVGESYLFQYISTRKVREKNKKTGEYKIIWTKTGQNDYRMADVHCWICLDILIPEEGYTLRDKVHQEGFMYNPALISEKPSDSSKPKQDKYGEVEEDDGDGDADDYDNGNYNVPDFEEDW